jgi:hypothetical protein
MKETVLEWLAYIGIILLIAAVGFLAWKAGKQIEYRHATVGFVEETIKEKVKPDCLREAK